MSKPSQEAGSRRSRKVWILVLLLSLLLPACGPAMAESGHRLLYQGHGSFRIVLMMIRRL